MPLLDGVHQQEMVHTMKTVAGITGAPRRQHEKSFKAELVEQCLARGASVAAVALAGANMQCLLRQRPRVLDTRQPRGRTLRQGLLGSSRPATTACDQQD